MLAYVLRTHVNNPFITKKKLEYTFNNAWILTHDIILSIHNIFNMCPFLRAQVIIFQTKLDVILKQLIYV